ncbi:CG0192-related protein [Arthrobacter antibioticus]|uniref:CG0192-related protein n=1 Tax=Arthrobacter sp. H35-MC1 TaxID=3046203 RepID=UPI0024BA3451|nr:hypothetical protein [Arthrobacter sp. H35-MC1]MDJ0317356.1 hypothetical protein [Arthrobacter sp. H35-MC1]
MATLYDAELSPSKSELLSQWLPTQPWFIQDATELRRLAAFRFDDPAGEVGIETHVVGVGGRIYQVPLTYRGAPLAGAEKYLITTMEHSVLGARWVYDATADPVYVHELAAALLVGKPAASENLVVNDGLKHVAPTALLSRTGAPETEVPELQIGAPQTSNSVTTIPAGVLNLVVLRELNTAGVLHSDTTLKLSWDGQEIPLVIAAANPA